LDSAKQTLSIVAGTLIAALVAFYVWWKRRSFE
jgi:LPXTG-motif cell wall-anchored protein